MEKQLAFYFDQRYCTGCKTCQTACKDKNNLEVGQFYRKVYEVEGGSFQREENAFTPLNFAYYVSVSCNHCMKPACIDACTKGAIKKRVSDGVVLVNPDKCIGCKLCVKACKHGAIQYIQDLKRVSKCNFCLDQLEQGLPPVCVAACPMRVLDYGELSDLKKRYGDCSHTYGMPYSEGASPALVITPHHSAIKAGE